MGMFDIKNTGKPMYAEDFYAQAGNMLSDQLAPGIKRTFGYENPNRTSKRKAMAIADKADTTNLNSIKSAHKQLQQINPDGAAVWLKEALSIYNAQTQSLTAQSQFLNARSKKTPNRPTFKGADGFTYFADGNKERVGPGIVKEEETKDLPQITPTSKEDVTAQVEAKFPGDYFGAGDTTTFPDSVGNLIEIEQDELASFVHSYSQIHNMEPNIVIRNIKQGKIDPRTGSGKGIPNLGSTTNGSNQQPVPKNDLNKKQSFPSMISPAGA